MGNVICGFASILSAFEGNIIAACWLVFLASVFDALDGKIARLSGATSRFGVELDSLADFQSFGVAPAIIIYIVHLQFMDKWAWIIAIIYMTTVGYRLARFNLLATTSEKKAFLGLPSPAAAMGIVSFIIFSFHLWGELKFSQPLISMAVLYSALMVSHFEYDAFPDNFQTKASRIKFIILFAAVIAIILEPQLLLFPLVTLYIIIGLIRALYRFFTPGKSANLEVVDIDELERVNE